MNFNPDEHHRRSIHIPDFDYSYPGVYFVTICTHNREILFRYLNNGEMVLNKFGDEFFYKSSLDYETIQLSKNLFLCINLQHKSSIRCIKYVTHNDITCYKLWYISFEYHLQKTDSI